MPAAHWSVGRPHGLPTGDHAMRSEVVDVGRVSDSEWSLSDNGAVWLRSGVKKYRVATVFSNGYRACSVHCLRPRS